MRWRLIVPLHHGRHLNDTLATIEVLPEAVTATNNKVNDVLDGASGAVPTTPPSRARLQAVQFITALNVQHSLAIVVAPNKAIVLEAGKTIDKCPTDQKVFASRVVALADTDVGGAFKCFAGR